MFRFVKIGITFNQRCRYPILVNNLKNFSIFNGNSPKNKISPLNYLPSTLSCLESTLWVPNDDLTPLKRLSGNHQYTSKKMLNILNHFNSETLKKRNDLLLLQRCGRVLVDQSFSARSELCDKVWKKLEEFEINFSINHYNIYLQNCIDNRTQINFRTFLDNMRCKPNQDTLRLLLECSCENGDAGQAAEILQEMKCRSYTADSKLFNTLVLGYAANGGLIKAKEVLETMRGTDMEITSETHFKLLRGLALYNNEEEFFSSLKEFNIKLQDHNYFDLLLTLGSKGNHTWLTRVLNVFGPLNMSNQHIQQLLTLLCKQLIYLNQSDSAIFYYKLFVKPLEQDNGEYAYTLLKNMVLSKTPVEKIIKLIDDLKTSNLNVLALEKLTNVALRNDTEVAWKLLERFTVLRPHYFWPILIESGQKQREIGIVSTLKKMIEWGVRPDCETLEYYCIPFCGLNNYQDLYRRMQSLGLTNRELFPPFLRILLKQNDVSACLEICKNNEVNGVSVEQILRCLLGTWVYTKDNPNITEILLYISKMSNKQLDYSGIFLCKTLRLRYKLLHYIDFFKLLKVMKSKNMFISSTSAESLLNILQKYPHHDFPLIKNLKIAIDEMISIRHLRHMNLQQLELHLIHLRHQNLETREVLGRLIPHHCNLGNEETVKELRQEFQDSGYKATTRINSSLMYLYIQKENVVDAFNTYKDLRNGSSNFKLNDVKIIDLAALLVKNNQLDAALKILEDETRERKVKDGEPLLRNCWRLLESANDEMDMQKLFQFLTTNGYCQVSNVVLGPLVKFYINRDDLIKAVEMFKDCVNKYNCTPQQLELLCQVVKVQNKELTEEVYNCIVKVHGSKSAYESLITALAQNGFTESLRKALSECKYNLNPLVKIRCDQWIKENNLQPLETLAAAVFRLPMASIDTRIIYSNIIKLHSKNNDYESAVKFYRNVVEKDDYAKPSPLTCRMMIN